MSWLGWGSSTNPQYEELVEKYCSPLNLPFPQSEDIATALEITDLIRSKAVQPKPAMQSLKRRIASKNGRVQMYAMGLVDTCIKNGGDHFLAEIASKEFVDEMAGMIRSPITNAEVKQMALKDFQQWALAFESKRELSFFTDTYREMKASGIEFPPPPTTTSAHLLNTTTAPAWVDSDVCMRCRTAFTFTNRKHHCRNCGLVFDQQCSSKSMPLPHFGVMEDVRVCESCWAKSGKGKVGPAPAVPGRTPRTRQDLDADLQRAIEMSLAEMQPGGSNLRGSEPPLRRDNRPEDDDEELRLAIEASLREMEARPSAPAGAEEQEYAPLPTFDLAPREAETILTFSNTLDQMAAYGERDLRRFPYAHVLYEQAYALGGKLHRNAEEKRTKQQMLLEMQDKISQAVGLYGQILDGQQAYSARKLQEQQQRQYQPHMYGYQPPQQYLPYGYDSRYASASPQPPQMNGYAPYAPQQYQPPIPSQTQAGPSLYPSIPSQSQFVPQMYQAQQSQYPQQHSPYRHDSAPIPAHAHVYNPPVAPGHEPYAPETHDRQQSIHHVPTASQRQASMTYVPAPASEVQGYTINPPSQINDSQPSAPPPIDVSSHPSASPQSATSTLPPQASSWKSPQPTAIPLPTSPQPVMHHPPQQQVQQPQLPNQAQGWPQPAQQQQQQQQPSQPSQSAQHIYTPNSFPQAPPTAVFPDAPQELPPMGVEKEEQKEALLIEL